jgi:hypothetical protein
LRAPCKPARGNRPTPHSAHARCAPLRFVAIIEALVPSLSPTGFP